MKKKMVKRYAAVVESAAKIIMQNTPEEAIHQLKLLPRSQRRLIQRFAKERGKEKGEQTNGNNEGIS